MKPHTLFVFLVFLFLWGANEALASSWLPHPEQQTPADQEVFPLALRYREQLLDQSIPNICPLLPDDLLPQPAPRRGPSACAEGIRPRPTGDTLLSLLMSLRC
jgi:hypothetical protein